jgi:hypothetical protein
MRAQLYSAAYAYLLDCALTKVVPWLDEKFEGVRAVATTLAVFYWGAVVAFHQRVPAVSTPTATHSLADLAENSRCNVCSCPERCTGEVRGGRSCCHTRRSCARWSTLVESCVRAPRRILGAR